MSETGEGIKIETASKGMSIGAMKEKVEGEREARKRAPVEVKVDFQPLIDKFEQIVGGQGDLLEAFLAQKISVDQFLGLSQKQAEDLAESFRRLSPEKERERWVDVEYKQALYTKFTPNLEPRFYTELSEEERELLDARWQLATAAFYKKSMASFPDKYRENKDLELLGKEQMERLYNMPGARQMLEGYAQTIVGGHKVELPSGEQMSFWDIKDAGDFEKFRRALRKERLASTDMNDLSMKEADAVGWNLVWVTNLVESADSRYSYSGASHSLPAIILASEYKYTLHPQERFEMKSFAGQNWGAFSTWGIEQAKRIKKRFGIEREDEIEFEPAEKGKYWMGKLLGKAKPLDTKKAEKGGRVFRIYAPECYPVASAKSFLEETSIEISSGSGKFEKKTLLDLLVKGEQIPWDEVAQDAWGIYLFAKFHKAVQLLEYFNPGGELKEREETEWTKPLLELFNRLRFVSDIGDTRSKKAKLYHNLRVWAVFAAFGGVKDPTRRDLTAPLTMMDKGVMQARLALPQIRYLRRGEKLDILSD